MSSNEPNAPREDRRGSRVKIERGIWQRGGKWIVGFSDAEGHWRTKTVVARNLTEARAAREKLRVDVRAGAIPVPSKVTFGAVAADFLETFRGLVASGERSERTLEVYEARVRIYLEPRLGRMQIQAVRPGHVSMLLADLRKRGLAPWTVRAVYTLVGVIFAHALTRGLVVESPLRRLSRTERPQGKARTKPRRLSSDEVARLLGSVIPGYRAVISTAALTGLRLSELLALRWQDVDFGAEVLHIRHQLSVARRDKPARLVPLKTDAGVRDIPLTPELAKLLRAHKLGSRYSQEADFVFATETGRPMSQRNVSRRGLEKAAAHAGLNEGDVPPLGMHDLRHTYISHLIRAGFDVVTVQRIAGHARPSITLDIYAGDFAERDRGADLAARIASTGLGSVLERS